MKIGFPNHPRSDIIKEIEWIGKNGFDFVDIFLEEDKAVPENIDTKTVRKVLKKYNLYATGHTAWYLPFGSPIESIRTAAVTETERYFKVFKELEVKFVTVHANWASGMFSDEESIAFQSESLRKLVKIAKKYNITVVYEPIDTPHDTVENIEEILKSAPGLYLHIDIGHSNVYGRKPVELIRRFSKRIRRIHLHDNNGKEDLHLPMGCGNINWEELIKVLKKNYDGTITLEIFSKDKDYSLLSKSKLRELWDRC